MIYTEHPTEPHDTLCGYIIYVRRCAFDNDPNQKQFGRCILISFVNGMINEWDILGNGVEIRNYSKDELREILHNGMTPAEVEVVFGPPSFVTHDDDQKIRSYRYIIVGETQFSIFGPPQERFANLF